MAPGGDWAGGNPIEMLLILILLAVGFYIVLRWRRRVKKRSPERESLSHDKIEKPMSNLYFISGIVSEVKTLSETQGYVVRGRGNISTSHKNLFRVDNKPVVFVGSLDVSAGDKITAVGYEKNGEVIARAVQNNSTGANYFSPIAQYYWVGGLLTLAGIPTSMFVIGIPILGIGLYYCLQGVQNAAAKRMICQRQFADQ